MPAIVLGFSFIRLTSFHLSLHEQSVVYWMHVRVARLRGTTLSERDTNEDALRDAAHVPEAAGAGIS